MKRLYIVTGSSKGLGKALTELLLNDDANNEVLGVARSQTVSHERYTHIALDLNAISEVTAFEFPAADNSYDEVVLVNNAGIIGDIDYVGKMNNETLAQTFVINTISPAILMNNFLRQYQSFRGKKTILNISSGAGKTAIDGWSAYCASKAAIDMFSQVAAKEAQITTSGVKIYALSPGIIDTQMQAQIRQADKQGFSEVERFVAYKQQGELATPEETARKIVWFLQHQEQFNEVLVSVRDF